MTQLHPTLWRTCRALSGVVRLKLLHLIFAQSGQNVTQLAESAGIGVSDASQELRRLQSRGLLRRSRQGPAVVFEPVPDPQVPTAAPLLKALQLALANGDAEIELVARIAKGLAAERRIALVRALRRGPQTSGQLALAAGRTAHSNLQKHVAVLKEGGWIAPEGRAYVLSPPRHPLTAALLPWL